MVNVDDYAAHSRVASITILTFETCVCLRCAPEGYTLVENSTVVLDDSSEYISGCADCVQYSSGEDLKLTPFLCYKFAGFIDETTNLDDCRCHCKGYFFSSTMWRPPGIKVPEQIEIS